MCQCANEEKFADGAQPISILAHYHISILISFPNIITFVLINKGKMTKVGLLSDTHGYWDEKYLQYFEDCDEIWHAGDIGSLEVAQKLAAFRQIGRASCRERV